MHFIDPKNLEEKWQNQTIKIWIYYIKVFYCRVFILGSVNISQLGTQSKKHNPRTCFTTVSSTLYKTGSEFGKNMEFLKMPQTVLILRGWSEAQTSDPNVELPLAKS